MWELSELGECPKLSPPPAPLLSPQIEKERRILEELVDHLEFYEVQSLWDGAEAYRSKQLDISEEAKAEAIEEAQREGYHWPTSWTEDVIYSAQEAVRLLCRAKEAYPSLTQTDRCVRFDDDAELALELKAESLQKKGHPFFLVDAAFKSAAMLSPNALSESSKDFTEMHCEIYAEKCALLLKKSRERLAEIRQMATDTIALRQQQQEYQSQKKSLEAQMLPDNIELIMRYQTSVSNQLDKAIARLHSLQQQRRDSHHTEFFRAKQRSRAGENA